jgi:hypothetical protein
MNEEFISYLWKYRQLSQTLITEAGDPLAILHPGVQNTDSGPDFFNARLRIGSTTWAGNVEIHVHASDWYRHGHHLDPAFDHAILHVVYDADRLVYHQNGVPVQTLVINNQYAERIFERYQILMQTRQWIPCENQLDSATDYGFTIWAPALAVERLEYKTQAIRHLLTGSNIDWDETFYQHLAGSFGFKINNLPFELLAKSLPLKIVRQHCNSRFKLEALLFGQAGMLANEFVESYPIALKQEYLFLCGKYNLHPIAESMWKFLRLRPSNFPTIRISQFAGFLQATEARFFNLFEGGTLDEVLKLFVLSASEYWNTHYVFGKPVVEKPKTMGPSGIKLIIINGLAPFLFFYGQEKGQPAIGEGVLDFLEHLGGENNVDIDHWKLAGFPADNAMQTQALLHLKHFYCDKKRCLECRIGSRLLADNRQ